MDSFVIEAWINDIAMAGAQPNTPSPSKRARVSHHADDEIVFLDLDKTPVRPPQMSGAMGGSTRSVSSFPTALAGRPVFSIQSSGQMSRSDSMPRSRSTSPSKRFQKTESLLGLAVPVQFIKRLCGEAVPDDAQALVQALAAIEAGEALLPAVLRSHPDFQNDPRIRRHTWFDDTQLASAATADYAAALYNHKQLRRIVEKSIASANKYRSEAGWNNLVHTPMLEHAMLHVPHLEVEPIPSAQIMPAFRPLLASGEQVPLPSSETSVSGRSGPATPARRSAAITTSVQKMVDYALVLRPSDALQSLIDRFLRGEPWEKQSINQTRYEPLRAQPAPIFIETKTTSGTQDSANVQLGIWVAAWYERMRTVAAQAGIEERLLTLPVIQVVGGVWSVLYVVDGGTHFASLAALSVNTRLAVMGFADWLIYYQRVLDYECRIGNTNTIMGIYQLQVSIAALGRWVEETFTPWIEDLLTRAVEGRA